MTIQDRRKAEIAQYSKEYEAPGYRMGQQRKDDVERLLRSAPRGTLLDVSTGRGETLEIAERLGFTDPKGTEVVPALLSDRVIQAEAHNLPFPDSSIDVVTCFDVLEHLIPEDVGPAITEMVRVARKCVILSASELPSVWNGRELHISRRPASEWEALIKDCSQGWTITRSGTAGGSPAWVLKK